MFIGEIVIESHSFLEYWQNHFKFTWYITKFLPKIVTEAVKTPLSPSSSRLKLFPWKPYILNWEPTHFRFLSDNFSWATPRLSLVSPYFTFPSFFYISCIKYGKPFISKTYTLYSHKQKTYTVINRKLRNRKTTL